jgi:hypothetical protein
LESNQVSAGDSKTNSRFKLAAYLADGAVYIIFRAARLMADAAPQTNAICYNRRAMIDTDLVAAKTVVNAKGDGPTVEVSGAVARVFLVTLDITQIIEQESLDLSIYGSADGATWGTKPVAAFPQKFYREESPLLLDLTAHADVKFVRAHWEVARWGRGVETPMFEFGVRLKEVPADVLREARAEAKALA